MPTFSKKALSFEEIRAYPRILLDYLSGQLDEKYYSYSFSEIGFSEAIDQRSKLPVDRELLHKVISEQYRQLKNKISPSLEVDKNISLVTKLNTFTVSTGHQLTLFTGPVYFIYKIITTINLASKLSGLFPSKNIIPVFWLASEDHDLDEINHIHLFGKKIEWNPPYSGAAGRISATGLKLVIDELKSKFLSNEKAEKMIHLFSNAYQDSHSLSVATRIIVHELFADKGIVVIDPDDERLKSSFVKEMKQDIEHHAAYSIVNETIVELEPNYRAQVHPREINLFYLDKHQRSRIIEKDGGYEVLETNLKFSKEQLRKEIESHPGKFSPNVVLRPLYQEKILPNIGYIGGPAEIAYWLEYKKMFEHFGCRLPVLVMRNSLTIIDAPAQDKLKKLGLLPEDLFLAEEALIKKYIKDKSSGEFSIDRFMRQTESIFDEAISQVSNIDSTLKPSVEAEKQKIQNSLRLLEEKIRRAEKKKYETAIHQLVKLKEKFFPSNALQERHENVLAFYSMYGEDFFNQLYMHLDPFEKKFFLLLEDKSA